MSRAGHPRNPPYPPGPAADVAETRTAEAQRKYEAALARARWDAWRAGCRLLLEQRHSCTGKGCRRAGHGDDAAWLRDVAGALGFTDERPGPTASEAPPRTRQVIEDEVRERLADVLADGDRQAPG